MALVNTENLASISYQDLDGDKYSHTQTVKELLSNIDKLKDLEKRLSFMLREIDLAVNKG